MAVSEHAPSIIDTLPLWAQIAANLGMFVVAVIAAAFGFMRKLTNAGVISDSHFEDGGSLHQVGDTIKGATTALVRIADAVEAILKIMQDHDRQADIDREVARRLKEYQAKQV